MPHLKHSAELICNPETQQSNLKAYICVQMSGFQAMQYSAGVCV